MTEGNDQLRRMLSQTEHCVYMNLKNSKAASRCPAYLPQFANQ